MKLTPVSAAILFLLTTVSPVAVAQKSNSKTPRAQAPSNDSANPGQQADWEKRAEAYYDVTMGHYYQELFEASGHADDANHSIEFYKRAYTLDPGSQVIGEQLSEVYFQAQRIREAVLEAQAVITKDPSNLAARRLLARIYVRTLGDLSDTTNQRDTLVRATEQYKEILRLDPSDSDAALWLARLYRLQNVHEEAETVLRALLAREPENESGIEQLTQLLLDQGKTDGAESLLQSALSRAPNGRLLDLLGDAYTQSHDLPKAEDAYRKATQAQPDDLNLRRELAQTLLNEDKYPEALEQFQRLTAMEPEDPENYLHQAEIYQQLKQFDKAEQNVLMAKERAPGNLQVIYYESSIYEAQGRMEDAIRVLSDAVAGVKAQSEFKPSRRRTLAILYQQLGQLYREAGNYDAAVNTLEEMRRLGPEEDRRARAMIIENYRAARDLPKALQAAADALQAYPKDRALQTTQALLYGANAQTDQAATLLRQLLDGSAADVEVQLDLAQVYEQARRWAEAEQAVHSAEKLAQQSSEREMTAFLLGAIFERQKKFDQAEAQFRTVLNSNPHNAPALNYLGYMLADRGTRLEEAIELIKQALAEEPNNPAYEDSLGWAYFKQNKLAEAEEWLRKAVSRERNDPTMLSHLGDVYAKAGKDSLAEAQWEKSLDEWRRMPPGEFEADKMSEVEQKVTALKRRLAQQRAPGDPKP